MSPVAPRLLSVDHLLLHGGHGPHTRRMDADTAKQRTVAYLSGKGRGNRCFGRHGLIAIVTPLSRTGSARKAASICLYSVYRKQERSLFTDVLEQTSNVPTTRNLSRSSGRVRRRACGLPYPVSGRQSRPSVALHVCFLASAPRRRRPGRCPPFHAPIPPATSTDCPAASDGGGGDSLAHRPGADGRRTFPVAPPGRFGCTTASYVDCPQAAMGSRYRPGTAPGPASDRPSPLRTPAGDPTPITQVKVRTPGEIESLDQDLGIRFPGN